MPTPLAAPASTARHCPHCLCALTTAPGDRPAPPHPMRCPHCRLLVAAGRAVDAAAAAEMRATGSAANVLGSAARRDRGEPREAAEVLAELAEAAHELGCPVDRLRMLDYDERVHAGASTIPVADVLATFPTWKQACRAAADAARQDD